MKKIFLIGCILLFTGCTDQIITQDRYQKILDNQEHLNKGQKEILKNIGSEGAPQTEEELEFDPNVISSINYELPVHSMLCIPEKRTFCVDGKCTTKKPSVFLAYNESEQILYRCDSKPCDAYNVIDSVGGIYRNLKSPNKDIRVKIQDSDIFPENNGNYVEITGAGLGVMLNFGNCKKNNVKSNYK